MKALKIAAIVLGALAALVAGGAAYLASPWFADFVKAQLVKVALEKKQRTLRIDGGLELSFWPSLGIRLGQASLSEHRSTAQFAAVESARVTVAVKPLLDKQVVVEAVAVDGLKARLVRHQDGAFNIDDLIAAAEPAGPPLQVTVAAIRLDRSELVWRDEKSGGTTTLAGLDLAAERVAVDTGSKAVRIAALSLAGRTSSARGALALGGIEAAPDALNVARLAIDIDGKAGELAFKGRLASPLAVDLARRTVALGRIAGDLDIAHPRLAAQRAKLTLGGALQADLGRQSAGGHVAAKLGESNLALKFKVPKFAPPALRFKLAIDRLDLDRLLRPNGGGAKTNQAAQFDLRAWQGLDIDGSVRVGKLRLGGLDVRNFALQLKSADGKLDGGALGDLLGN